MASRMLSGTVVAGYGAHLLHLHQFMRGSRAGRVTRELLQSEPESIRRALPGMLHRAATLVPYWRDRLDRSADLYEQFLRLPPLGKDDIRAAGTQLLAEGLDESRTWTSHSGGSTGAPIGIVHDKDYADWSLATQRWYFQRRLRSKMEGAPRVILWGSEADIFGMSSSALERLGNRLTQTLYLNSFSMGPREMRLFCEQINAHEPVYIRGYAGSLDRLARFALENGIRLHRPELVISSAETLSSEMRTTVQTAFGTHVFDFYGSREVGPIAAEVPDGSMEIFRWFNYVEVVDASGDATPSGQTGRVLVTSLRNACMPLLRYDIGDTAVVGRRDDDGCVTHLERVTGRVTDHFVGSDGRLIHGEYFTHLFYGVEGIHSFQVVQHQVGEVEILWVGEESLDPATVDDIAAKMRLVLGDTAIMWTNCAEIPPTPQGKHLFTRSHALTPGGR